MSSSTAENGTKKITLRSSDGEVFEVEEAVAVESQTIKHMIEDDCADNVIPLPNVTGKILSKVIEYCKRHADKLASDEDLKAFDADFVKVDLATLVDLIRAARYLNIKSLVHLTWENLTKGKTPDENYFTPEERGGLKREPGGFFTTLFATDDDLTCGRLLRGNTPEEIRTTLNIKNDFTPEEEEQEKHGFFNRFIATYR